MLRTAAEGYKVLQLNRQSWPANDVFYRMTLGNARALSLDGRIGSIEEGRRPISSCSVRARRAPWRTGWNRRTAISTSSSLR